MRRCLALALAIAGCNSVPRLAPDGGAGGDDAPPPDARPPRRVTITATVTSTRFVTREHMLAGGEMQLSGEPLAEAMGRRLPNFSRDRLPTDLTWSCRRSMSC